MPKRELFVKEKPTFTMIPIYAAVSPDGQVVKSSVGTFMASAKRFAAQRRNYSVIKLAEISANIIGAKPDAVINAEPQHIESDVEVPLVDVSKPDGRRRKFKVR